MIIANNHAANRAYAPYVNSMANLQKAAARLSTGEKYVNAEEGTGELGVAHRMRNNLRGTQTLIAGIQDSKNMAQSQDDIMGQVADVVTRMYELATSAVDPSKSAADRDALDIEFQVLSAEVADVVADATYNGNRLFETTRTLRIGMEATDVVVLSAIRLSLLTFGTLNVSTVALASAAIVSLNARVGSLAVLRARARGHAARLERTLEYTQNYVANLANSESAIRDIDVAVETGNYTKRTVQLNAAQAVLSQANGLTQSALQFLQNF